MFPKLIYVAAFARISFLFYGQRAFHGMNIPPFVYPFTGQ